MQEMTGKVHSIMIDPVTRKFVVSFLVDTGMMEDVSPDTLLRINVKPYKQRRSLDANAYFWVLCSKLAEKNHTDKDFMYEIQLRRYGVEWVNENGEHYVFTVPVGRPTPDKIGIHAKWVGHGWLKDKEYDSYILLKGSSEYDSAEMSRLINGTVQDCKELGIETMTPDELAAMLARWRT